MTDVRRLAFTVSVDTKYIDFYANELVEQYPVLKGIEGQFKEAATLLIETFAAGKKLLICGNGGSASDAEHIVGELMKGFCSKRPLPQDIQKKIAAAAPDLGAHIAASLQCAYPAIALVCHTSLNTAFSNDVDASLIYAQQVLGYGTAGDVLIGISTSGNSKNVIAAAITAKALDLKVIALTGKTGGKLASYCDILLNANETETYKIQELHLPIYHRLCLAVERTLTPY